MRTFAALLCFGFVLPAAALAQSSPIIILSSNATKAVVEALGPGFEKASGQQVLFKFANSAELKARIDEGEAFDVAILTAPLVGELVTSGRLTAASRTDIARSGVGMAIHPLAIKPDVSSADALKGALIRARSIALVDVGASAPIMRAVFERFGLSEAMQAKTVLVESAAHAVAAREAELGFTQISEILNVAGAELADPLPPELQVYTTFQAAVSPTVTSAVAQGFIAFVTSAASAPVIRAKGMEVPAGLSNGQGGRWRRPATCNSSRADDAGATAGGRRFQDRPRRRGHRPVSSAAAQPGVDDPHARDRRLPALQERAAAAVE